MLLSVFEKYIFLQSLGWGIANSLWQAALLWMLYQYIVTINKNLPALFKHHLSLLLLFISFVWFIVTTGNNYLLVKDSGDEAVAINWLNISENMATPLQYLSVVYLGLLLAHIVKFVRHLKGIHSLQSGTFIKAPVDTRIFTEQTALHIGIHKKVSIWLSENVEVPSVVGFLKPMILLPVAALNNLTTGQAEAIILHELAHIKRNDYIINLFQSLVELFLFFNPFAKLLGKIARIERENCCDDWVLNYRYNKHDYASALLVLEQNRLQFVQLALAATNGKKNLLSRIKRLFAAEPQVNMSFKSRIKLTTAAFILMTGVFFVLPVIGKKATIATQQTTGNTPAEFASLQLPVKNYDGFKNLTIISDKPVQPSAINHKTAVIKKELEEPALPVEQEYTEALVNEELLNADKNLQEVAVQVADKEDAVSLPSLIVKVEEEASGVKDKKTYLIELKNNNGTAEIKPLVLLNKRLKALTGKLKNISSNTISDSIKTTLRKRITS